MPHIHTAPGQHDLTASAYIVRTGGSQPVVLLHKHKLLGKYLQFGGHVELTETPWQAIVHEISEESGYTISQLLILQPKHRITALTDATIQPQPATLITHRFGDSDHFHTDIAFAFCTTELPAYPPAEGESHDITAYTAAELDKLPASQIFDSVRQTSLFVLQHCLAHWERVDTASYQL